MAIPPEELLQEDFDFPINVANLDQFGQAQNTLPLLGEQRGAYGLGIGSGGTSLSPQVNLTGYTPQYSSMVGPIATGQSYAQSIAGGMPMSQVIASGVSYSPDMPGGYTQADLNMPVLTQAPSMPRPPAGTGDVSDPNYPTMPYAPTGTPMPETLPSFFGQIPKFDPSQLDIFDFFGLKDLNLPNLPPSMGDVFPSQPLPKGNIPGQDIPRNIEPEGWGMFDPNSEQAKAFEKYLSEQGIVPGEPKPITSPTPRAGIQAIFPSAPSFVQPMIPTGQQTITSPSIDIATPTGFTPAPKEETPTERKIRLSQEAIAAGATPPAQTPQIDTSKFLTKEDVSNIRSDILKSLPAPKSPDVSQFVTQEDINKAIAGIPPVEELDRQALVRDIQSQLKIPERFDPSGLESQISGLQSQIQGIPQFDPTGLQGQISGLQQQLANIPQPQQIDIGALRQDILSSVPQTNLAGYITESQLQQALQGIPQPSMPDVSQFVTQADINRAIAGIPQVSLSDIEARLAALESLPTPAVPNLPKPIGLFS